MLGSQIRRVDSDEAFSLLLPLRTAPDLAYLAGSLPAVQAVLDYLKAAEVLHLTPGKDLRPDVQVQGQMQLRTLAAMQL
jgi:hypothetical protein